MRISVVIPTYNYGHFLRRAIDSVLAQSVKTEIIVVDDGSLDDTPQIMESILHLHSNARIRFVRQTNAGPSAARNHGVAFADGDWIAFLDADDYWYPGKLASQIRFAARHPHAVLYFAGVDMENLDGMRRRWLPKNEGAITWSELLGENVIPSPTPLLRKDAFLRAGKFNENRRYAEDWELWLRVLDVGEAVGQRQALACYIDHGSGLHRNEQMLEASWQVLLEALGRKDPAQLEPGLTDRVCANMVGSEAFLAAENRDYPMMLRRAFEASCIDYRQFPRMVWCGLYSLIHPSL